MDIEPIIRRFSRASKSYDDHAVIQRVAAANLIERTRDAVASAGIEPSRILDAGCGTGLYTALLANEYPRATVTAVDPSTAMLDVARTRPFASSVDFRHASSLGDGDTYDLISSNAALHWSPNLAASLAELRIRLRPHGLLTCALFGPQTYRELSTAMETAVGRPVRLPASRFPDRVTLHDHLARLFAAATVAQVEYTQRFETLRDLLTAIKKSGVRGDGESPALSWTRGLIDRIEEAYRSHFGEIVATHQILIGTAQGEQAL
ncbi:MAG: methyltransferase domain-containing protein [Capsulimonadaceae bacterium]|nr:methyltransferase domain-containing protein [Capsulimonadaceae bacterium]